jgi:hypothetical protein
MEALGKLIEYLVSPLIILCVFAGIAFLVSLKEKEEREKLKSNYYYFFGGMGVFVILQLMLSWFNIYPILKPDSQFYCDNCDSFVDYESLKVDCPECKKDTILVT